MQIYIAGPLFNGPQIKILERIESLCEAASIGYYSPRLHSGSHLLSPEDKKNFDAWTPVFKRNADAIQESDLVLAVLSYAMPDATELGILTDRKQTSDEYIGSVYGRKFTPLQLPDSGTVWEMGNAYALRIPVIGYMESSPKQLNLMLSHCCEGLILGEGNLRGWFDSYVGGGPWDREKRFDSKFYHNLRSEIE